MSLEIRRRRRALVQGIYPILSDPSLPIERFPEVAKELRPYVSILQLRFKKASGKAALESLRAVKRALLGWDGLLVVNDRLDLLMLTDTSDDGPHMALHLGQDDIPLLEARKLLPPTYLLGYSTHKEKQLFDAIQLPLDLGPDYLAYGPIYPTASKQDPDPIVGLSGLKAARQIMEKAKQEKPLVAIGGINLTRFRDTLVHADAVALIGALFSNEGADSKAYLHRIKAFTEQS